MQENQNAEKSIAPGNLYMIIANNYTASTSTKLANIRTIYIYIYTYIHVYIYIYIYTHTRKPHLTRLNKLCKACNFYKEYKFVLNLM